MASLSRPSRPVLLDLSDEDFARGYVGSRPPSLIAPAPKGGSEPPPVAASQRAGHGRTIAVVLAAVVASVVTTHLLRDEPRAATTVGMEAEARAVVPKSQKLDHVDTSAKPPQLSKPVLAEVAKAPSPPAVQPAFAAPVAKASAAPAKPPAATAVTAKAEPEPAAAPATPTYGIDEAGF